MFHPVELLNEWETRSNRSLRRAPREADFLAAWASAGKAAQLAPLPLPPSWLVVLTTYQRPGGAALVLERLEQALAAAGARERAALLVLHDRCDADYDAARSR